MRIIKIIIVISMIISTVGCGSKEANTQSDVTPTSKTTSNTSKTDLAKSSELPAESNDNTKDEVNNEEGTTIIRDIKNWSHSTKEVLEVNDLKVMRVELTEENTYPTYIVASISEDLLTKDEFLYSMAKHNGFWNFKITDNKNYVEVYCDKQDKIINKIITNTKTMDINDIKYANYNGIWYDTAFLYLDDAYSNVKIKFKDNSNQANITLSSLTKSTGEAQISVKTCFDYSGKAIIHGTDSAGSKFSFKITLDDESFSLKLLSKPVIKDKSRFFIVYDSGYVRESDYFNIRKAMDILSNTTGIENAFKNNYDRTSLDYDIRFEPEKKEKDQDSPIDQDSYDVYFRYLYNYGDGEYHIGVFRCKDTVVVGFYTVNTVTGSVERRD